MIFCNTRVYILQHKDSFIKNFSEKKILVFYVKVTFSWIFEKILTKKFLQTIVLSVYGPQIVKKNNLFVIPTILVAQM